MSSKRCAPKSLEAHTALTAEDQSLFDEAWRLARKHHGQTLDLYLPGMIRYGNFRGRYPAISITGNQCWLMCDHCKGLLLGPMVKAETPDDLSGVAEHLKKRRARHPLNRVWISDIFLDSKAVDMASNKFHKAHY